jgi:hypothetical protein
MTTSRMKGEYERNKNMMKNYIIEALRQLGKPSLPYEIHAKVNEIIEEEIITENERENRKRDLRTIKRRLKEMVADGLIERNEDNNRYSLTDRVKSNIKYYASQFGGYALANIMSIHWPTIFHLEINVRKLVEMFGVYMIYCFIEAARPVNLDETDAWKGVDRSEVKKIKKMKDVWVEKDNLARQWIENVFPTSNMYDYFLSTFQHQPHDRDADRNLKQYEKNKAKSKLPSIQDLAGERFEFLTWPYGRKRLLDGRIVTDDRKEIDELSEHELGQQYELNEEMVKRLAQTLKTAYPMLYNKLLEARAGFLGKPKEMSQSQGDSKLGYFDPITEETVIHRKQKI